MPHNFSGTRQAQDKPVVLLVEDEALLVISVEDELIEAGYEVFSALNGLAAIQELNSEPAKFFCLVTDIRLGTATDGWAVARHARTVNPDIVVVYMTGNAAAEWGAEGVPDSIMLHKPLLDRQLASTLGELYGRASSVA